MDHAAQVAGVAVDTRHWIGGQRVASAAHVHRHLAHRRDADRRGRQRAGGRGRRRGAAAARAFPAWGAVPPAERARILHAIADGVEARVEDLARVETTRQRLAAALAPARGDAAGGGQLPVLRRPPAAARPRRLRTRGHRNHVSWDPAGVTAVITPWNAPLMLATWRVAPALAAGNTVVAQAARVGAAHRVPAGRHRGRGRAARRRAQRPAGPRRRGRRRRWPPTRGCAGSASPGPCRPPGPSGSPPRPASPRCRFELGGKSPLLVLDDADLDLAVSLAVEQFDNAGQVCLAAVRILVHERDRRRVPRPVPGPGARRCARATRGTRPPTSAR